MIIKISGKRYKWTLDSFLNSPMGVLLVVALFWTVLLLADWLS